MRIAIIGRSEILYETAIRLHESGHEIALVLTAKEAPEYLVTAEEFKGLAERFGCPYLRTAKIIETIDDIKAIGPIDISVSMNYSGVIPQQVIDLFPLGILNAHAGDLPRYRGNACQAWAIINGERQSGLCIHRMIGGELDSGDIIARDYHPITASTKITELWDWMAQRVPVLFEQAVDALEADPGFVIDEQSKDPADALRCYPRKPEDGRIDWRSDSGSILRLINASNRPYAGAFGQLDGEKLIIWDAEPVDDQENFLAIAGQITRLGNGFIQVATGSGKLQVNEVEYKGTVTTPDRLIASLRTRLE